MTNKEIIPIWEKLSACILDEITTNEAFAQKLLAAVNEVLNQKVESKAGTEAKPNAERKTKAGMEAKPDAEKKTKTGTQTEVKTPKRSRRAPAKIDPFVLYEQSPDTLCEALTNLSPDELKDIIAAYGMDTAKLAMRWKNRDRLEKFILETTQRRSSIGEAFWS